MVISDAHVQSLVTPDGAMILDVKRNLAISLNASGAYIWRRVREGSSVDVIIHDMADDTGVDLAIVERDVCEFLEDLSRRNLVTLLSGEGGGAL